MTILHRAAFFVAVIALLANGPGAVAAPPSPPKAYGSL